MGVGKEYKPQVHIYIYVWLKIKARITGIHTSLHYYHAVLENFDNTLAF